MKRFIIYLFIVMFVGVAGLGLSFMAHDGNVSHDGCLTGGVFNVSCVQGMSALPMISLHFDALSHFSSATFLGLPGGLVLLLIGSLLSALLGGIGGVLRISSFVARYRQSFDLIYSAFHRRLANWLASYTKRDPAITGCI